MQAFLRPVLVVFLALTVLTGGSTPWSFRPGASPFLRARDFAGSLILRDGKVVGSSLIGQSFSDPGNFWGRPSATGPTPYNAAASGGSNLGPLNPALADAVKARVAALRAADPGNTTAVPIDLVTASAGGLDPHISVAAARYQVARVAKARGLSADKVQALVDQQMRVPLGGLFGTRERARTEPRAGCAALVWWAQTWMAVLLALAAVCIPLAVAWYLLSRGRRPGVTRTGRRDSPDR